jgi:hypothetical protein
MRSRGFEISMTSGSPKVFDHMAGSTPIDLGPQAVWDSFAATWAGDASDDLDRLVEFGRGDGLAVAGLDR